MRYEEEIIELRREFHKCAEIGWLEFETTIKIIEYLNTLGLKVIYGKSIHSERMGLPNKKEFIKHKEKILNRIPSICREEYNDIFDGYTGVIATLDTGRDGNATIFRFDIDGLPIKESEESDHLPFMNKFISKNNNMMHACGHDCHIAMGLILAKKLVEMKENLSGKFIFIFQPAEEGVRGANSIVNSKVGKKIFQEVDYFLSSHIGFIANQDEIICCSEDLLGTTKFDVSFHGVAAHAGVSPENGKNALLAACTCTLNLHTFSQFSQGVSRINVGKLESGQARNIVPNFAKLEIETRSNKEEINKQLSNKLESCVEGASLMHGVDYDINMVGLASNYEKADLEFGKQIYNELLETNIKPILLGKFGASEDVTCMMKITEEVGGRAAYMIIGTDRKYPHHNEKFDINEGSLIQGVQAYIRIISNITNLL